MSKSRTDSQLESNLQQAFLEKNIVSLEEVINSSDSITPLIEKLFYETLEKQYKEDVNNISGYQQLSTLHNGKENFYHECLALLVKNGVNLNEDEIISFVDSHLHKGYVEHGHHYEATPEQQRENNVLIGNIYRFIGDYGIENGVNPYKFEKFRSSQEKNYESLCNRFLEKNIAENIIQPILNNQQLNSEYLSDKNVFPFLNEDNNIGQNIKDIVTEHRKKNEKMGFLTKGNSNIVFICTYVPFLTGLFGDNVKAAVDREIKLDTLVKLSEKLPDINNKIVNDLKNLYPNQENQLEPKQTVQQSTNIARKYNDINEETKGKVSEIASSTHLSEHKSSKEGASHARSTEQNNRSNVERS